MSTEPGEEQEAASLGTGVLQGIKLSQGREKASPGVLHTLPSPVWPLDQITGLH